MKDKKRILIHTSYDGTLFHGSALQSDKRTVESELNRALSQLTGDDITIISASRTDAGVHARDLVSVFDTTSSIPGERFSRAINPYLPKDICVWSSMETDPDFHPRRIHSKKTYEYHILTGEYPDPILRNHLLYTDYSLDIETMGTAASYLVGEHDFTSFCAAGSQSASKVRTIYKCNVSRQDGILPGRDPFSSHIIITVQGSGFLYNMVRIIAGTLMEVGRGRISPSSIKDILSAKDRSLAGPTAPAHGLLLLRYEMLKD